uniref:Uncharacterized protein n=1 Tax=Oryza brachyantha TaxID=4533 RepID=J3MCE5_ORYBR
MALSNVKDTKRAMLLAVLVIAVMVYSCCAEEEYCEPTVTVPCDNITCPRLCEKMGVRNARAYCKPGELVPSCCCRKQSTNVRRLLLSE